MRRKHRTLRSAGLEHISRRLHVVFGSLTTRGRSLMAAGGAVAVCGLAIPEPGLVRVGTLLVILPAMSALIARTSRYRLSCSRRLDPPRVPVGQPAVVTARVENVSRLRTRVLLAEDVIPGTLGSRPRLVVDEIGPGSHQELSYQIRPSIRGKFTIGPLRIRVADAFGLVETSHPLKVRSTLTVTPKIDPLPRVAAQGSRPGEDDSGIRTISATGEHDGAPRVYQDGDSLRQVHWKSTARHGELMVRREEHQPRDSASVFLDTRRCAHTGSGPASTFEFAVSAAASIGVHLADEGFRTRLITETGEIAPRGTLPATLLDMLAVITPSADTGLRTGMSALAAPGGQLIAVAGRLSADEVTALAAARRGNAPAMALLLAVSSWESGGACRDASRTAEILAAAGWRVAVITAHTPLAAAWQQLHRPLNRAERLAGAQ
jgi:uncharacterized protein (DUF58 family)